MTRRYKDWKLKDFQNYYKENYSGKSRSEVFGKDGGFYMTIRNKGFLDGVFPSTKWRWGGFSLKDFQDYYKKNYSGKSRNEILKEDYGFYQVVQRRKLLNSVFPKNKSHMGGGRNGKFSNFSLNDFQDYYKKNYSDKGRSEVFGKDSAFYNAIQRRKLLNSVFPKKKSHTGGGSKGKFSNFSLNDFQDYYKKNYSGIGREELSQKASGFYTALYNKELLDEVLPKDKRGKIIRSYHNWRLRDFREYYDKNFKEKKGITNSKGYQSFYQAVRVRNLVDKLIIKKNKKWKDFTLKDFKNYYNEFCKGLSRTEISIKYSGFYSALYDKHFANKILSDELPKVRKSKFANFSKKDLESYYKKDYNKKSRTEIYKSNNSFYFALRNAKLIDKIMPKKSDKFKNFSLKEFKDYYNKHYPSLSIGEIAKEDSSFYKAIHNRHLADKMNIYRKTKSWKNLSLEELKKYANDNFQGLEKKLREYLGFRAILYKNGLLNKVFPKKEKI